MIPAAVREWLTRLWATIRRTRSDADLEDELRSHLELAAEDERRRGLPPEAAARAARVRAGGVSQAIERQRDQRALPWLEDLGRDVRYAFRTLLRARGFAVVAIISLAVGIGANTAIVTLMDAVLFRTVPVHEPERLFFLGHDPGPNVDLSGNYPIFERYKSTPAFSGVTAYRSRTFRVRTADGIERVPGQYVSGNYHAVVGVPIVLGRGFLSEPDRQPGSAMLAVISHELWTTRFGGSADAIGKTLTISDRQVTIVGVTAAGFHGMNAGARYHITLPMSVMALDEPKFFDAYDGWVELSMIGRLALNTTEPQAAAATEALFQQFIQEPKNGWVRQPNRQRFRNAALVPAARGTFFLRRQYGHSLWVLMAMVAALLLVACANVASLVLARAADRGGEIAIRLSIGAGRSRLIRQLLTESVVLALLGGAAGVLVAIWGTGAILSVFAIGPTPAIIDAAINLRVLAVTTAVVLVTAIAVGLIPAFRSTRLDLAPALKDGMLSVHGARRPALGKTLVVGQIALSMVLVTAAILLSRSLQNLHRLDAGFARDHVVLADVDLAGARLAPEVRQRAFADLLERLRGTATVQSASLSTRTPIDFSTQLRRIEVPGFEAIPLNGVTSNVVTPGYFQTFGLKLIGGRDISDEDRAGSPPVAVISHAMAQHFFAGGDPIGKTFVLGASGRKTTIVGVVEDARHENLRTASPSRMVYLPMSQLSEGPDGAISVPNQLALAVRTGDDATAVASHVRAEMRSISNDALVRYVRTMAQQIDATLIPERLLTTLSTAFAGVALLLACVGLYGVMAYNVARRRREIGLRIALGAFPAAILRHVLREASIVAVIGILVGLPVALGTMRLLDTFLFELDPHDASTLVATVGVLLCISLVAGLLPARRAATIDPVEALRDR
jgi:macrolide transport system ATP-binding/permease protein